MKILSVRHVALPALLLRSLPQPRPLMNKPWW
ncbi:Uncharacterised protein [Klebsiella pneumoniae]|nr:Uncharacterised protein [Klebsiella pneumoniae]VAQ99419.1 Uncharacterised protein [Klebsiella pneumoniae]